MYLIQKQTFFANKTQFQSANWRRIKQTTVQIIDWFIGGGRTNVFLLNFEIMHEKKKFIQKLIFWESEKFKKKTPRCDATQRLVIFWKPVWQKFHEKAFSSFLQQNDLSHITLRKHQQSILELKTGGRAIYWKIGSFKKWVN